MELWPADGIHFALVDNDIIILNVEADQYACLIEGGDWINLTESGTILTADEASACELLAAGLASHDRPSDPRRHPVKARRERPLTSGGRPAEVVGVCVSLLRTTLAFRTRRFCELIRVAERPPRASNAAGPEALDPILAAYRSALPWVPLEGECLQRAFLLHQLLNRRGIATDWVFGVRTWPFAAHCWLQIGDEVVGDSLARTGLFTPILVV